MAEKGINRAELRRMARIAAELGEAPDTSRLSAADVDNLLYEFGVYQAEILAQNEELENLREELEVSRDRYAALYEHAPVGYLTLGAKNTVVRANLPCCAMLGALRSDLVGSPLVKYVAPDDQSRLVKALKAVREDREPETAEVALAPGNNVRPSHVRIDLRPFNEEAGEGAIFAAVTDMSERKRYEEKLTAALNQKESMLHEIHHRVKNNLQVILGLLEMTRGRTSSAEAAEVIGEVQGKIQAMAQIHAALYRQEGFEGFERIEMSSFARELFGRLSRLHDHGRVAFEPDGNGARLDLDRAVPLGLALNELFVNALKYAYPEGEGVLRCRIEDRDGFIRVEVADDGPGLPRDLDPYRTRTLGFKLVRDLIGLQLGGTAKIEGEDGTRIVLEFPKSA
jgi:PAS domain S-box-containing protein